MLEFNPHTGLELSQQLDAGKYIGSLLDYLETSPPTAGHGFNHLLQVAVTAVKIGRLNDYPDLFSLYVGGLYHDIYRPAEGRDGEDDQTPGADISRQVLTQAGCPAETIERVSSAILSHDSWRGSPDPPLFDLVLSLADKATHDTDIVYGYAWASNKSLRKKVYSSHIQTLYAFSKYQVRAWEVIYKHQIPGSELAAAAYIGAIREVTDHYQADPQNRSFDQLLESKVAHLRSQEHVALSLFSRSPSSISRITSQL